MNNPQQEQPTMALQVVSNPPDLMTTDSNPDTTKQRILELVELVIESLNSDPTLPVQGQIILASMGPVFLMGLSQIETEKLKRLVTCLGGMLLAASKSDSSQREYEDEVFPLIEELVEVSRTLQEVS